MQQPKLPVRQEPSNTLVNEEQAEAIAYGYYHEYSPPEIQPPSSNHSEDYSGVYSGDSLEHFADPEDEDLSDLDLEDPVLEDSDPTSDRTNVDPALQIPPPDPEEMLRLLKSEVTLERMQAARAFCEIEDPRAITDLIPLLADDCALVRVSAAYAIGRNPGLEAVNYLIEQLQTDWNGYVRKGVVWALGTCGSQAALNPLISALHFDIAAVRLWAASALGQLGNLSAIAPLTQALQTDKVDAVRSNCAWALGKLLGVHTANQDPDDLEIYEEAIDALIGALEDDDLGVRDDARLTLRKLQYPRGLKVIEKIELDQGFCDLF
jgi:HEAT repeat protein